MNSLKKLDNQPLNITFPTCSFESYAAANGVTKEIVRGWAKNGIIPTIKLGRYRVVNIAKLTLQLTK